MPNRRRAISAVAACVVVAGAVSVPLIAHDGASSTDGVIDNAKITHNHHQHGGDEGHLPAGSSNVQLVSKLRLKNVEPGKIADVGVHKGFAYLAAWGGETCRYNGVHVVDIRNPAVPKEVAFIQAKEGSAAGEGVQALTITTPQFSGDVLVSNNEICKDKAGFGGLNIYDVSKPTNPTVLTEGFGDETSPGQGKKDANEIHSVYAWDAGDKAYAVIVDNEEGPDVDIVDISNPKKPTVVAEYDLDERFPTIAQASPANLVEVFHHDMIVKQINGRWLMLVSYWDGGYVVLDVTNPANATYVADSDFASIDPELFQQRGLSEAPEGNAHQAEFTLDNRYIVAADEDFNPTGLELKTNDDPTPSLAVPGDTTPRIPVGTTVTAPTKMVGLACPGDTVPAGDGTQIAVVVRGVCSFTEKVATVQAAGGYIGAIVVNREGADGCGAFAMSVEGGIPSSSVSREIGYGLFDVAGYNDAACRAGAASLLPGVAIGATGDVVSLRSFFDGWGYIRLFKNGAGKLVETDTFAIPEAMDPSRATGSGDLSVHEVAVSERDARLVYVSYYAGGLRVLRIGADEKLSQVGHYIDADGNNFWGVQVFQHTDGREYVAASDRDSGLYIFRHTP